MEREARQRAIEVADELIRRLETPGEHLKEMLRMCHRLAVLAQRKDIEVWTCFELQGFDKDDTTMGSRFASDWRVAAAERFVRTRRQDLRRGDKQVSVFSVEVIETTLETFKALLSHGAPDPSMQCQLAMVQYASTLDRIRNEVHVVATEILSSLLLGDAVTDVFEQARDTVGARLAEIAPEAVQELQAAYRSLRPECRPEELAYVGASCRRALRDLADALCPPQPHGDLNAERYRNRLVAYAKRHACSGKWLGLWSAAVDSLEARLTAVDKMAAKGDHSDITYHEASMCLIQTYLLVADLLQLPALCEGEEE